MTPLFKKFLGMHWLLFAVIAALIITGVFTIYAATEFREGALALKWRSQIQWALIGLPIYVAAAVIDYRWLKWGVFLGYPAGLALLVSTQFIGIEVHGSKSWIDLGPMLLQPSQPMIAVGIIAIAYSLAEMHKHISLLRYHFLRLVAVVIIAGIPAILVLKEGDFGSFAVWGVVIAAMLLVGSIPLRYLIAIALAIATVVPVAYNFGLQDYQKARIEVFIAAAQDKPIDVQGDGWALDKSLKAIGSSGWEGKGFLGKNVPGQKTMNRIGFIPADVAFSDFAFTTFAEEQGFRGSLLLIGGYSIFLLLLFRIAFAARDQLGRLIVIGIAALFFAHIYENIGMVIGLAPITGIPLPFISYGGTFLVTLMALLGLVQSVWVHRNTPAPEKRKEPTLD